MFGSLTHHHITVCVHILTARVALTGSVLCKECSGDEATEPVPNMLLLLKLGLLKPTYHIQKSRKSGKGSAGTHTGLQEELCESCRPQRRHRLPFAGLWDHLAVVSAQGCQTWE